MKSEAQIRERIIKLNMELKKKSVITTQKQLERVGMRALMLIAERYSLWWVLGEVRKHQGRNDYPGSDGVRRELRKI